LLDFPYRRLLRGTPEPPAAPDNAAARTAWVKSRLAALPSGWRLLDAGAGECPYREHCGHLRYVSQDFGKYDGRGDGAGLQTQAWDNSKLDIVSDICAIPEPDASFDAVLCTEVLEHLPEPVAAVREFARLLRPGGVLLLTAPICSLTHFAPYHYCTGFNRYWYEKWLPECGFQIAELTPNGNFFDYIVQEVSRFPRKASKYAPGAPRPGRRTRFLRDLAHRVMLNWLAELSAADTGSSELLCFGYHVRAVKLT